MFCDNCGKQIKDGAKFCDACGKRVAVLESNNEQTPAEHTQNSTIQASQNTNNVNPEPEIRSSIAPKKSKKWIKPAVIIAIILILSLSLVYAAPFIKNTAQKLYYSPEDYFNVVMKRELKQSTDEVGTLLTSFDLNSFIGDKAAEFETKVEVGDKISQLIDADWFKNASLSLNSSNVGSDLSLGGTINLNDSVIAGVNLAFSDGVLYIRLPEISSQAIKIKVDDFIDYDDYYSSPFYSYEQFLNSKEFKAFKNVIDALPDRKLVQKLLYKYMCCLIDQVDIVSESSDKLKAGELEQNCTKLSVTFNEELVKKCAIAVLKNLKTDTDVKSVIEKVCSIDELNLNFNEVYSEFINSIDEGISELSEHTPSNDNGSLKLDFWVNSRGDFAGWGISQKGVSISEVYLQSRFGKDFGYALNAGGGFGQTVSLEGSGSISGNKKTGTFYVKAAGQKLIKVSVRDLDTQMLTKGDFEGSITMELDGLLKQQLSAMATSSAPSELREMMPLLSDLKIKLQSNDKSDSSENVVLSVNNGNELLASIQTKATITKAKNIDIPKNCTSIKTERQLERWSKTININKIWNNLLSAGMPRALVNQIKYSTQY